MILDGRGPAPTGACPPGADGSVVCKAQHYRGPQTPTPDPRSGLQCEGPAWKRVSLLGKGTPGRSEEKVVSDDQQRFSSVRKLSADKAAGESWRGLLEASVTWDPPLAGPLSHAGRVGGPVAAQSHWHPQAIVPVILKNNLNL